MVINNHIIYFWERTKYDKILQSMTYFVNDYLLTINLVDSHNVN